MNIDRIDSVKWNPQRDELATASQDKTVKTTDFGTAKVVHEWKTGEKSTLTANTFA